MSSRQVWAFSVLATATTFHLRAIAATALKQSSPAEPLHLPAFPAEPLEKAEVALHQSMVSSNCMITLRAVETWKKYPTIFQEIVVTLDVAPHTPDAASEFPESSSGKACLSLIEGRLGNVPQPTRTRLDLMNYADSEHVASIFHDALGCDFHGFDTLSPGKMSCGV